MEHDVKRLLGIVQALEPQLTPATLKLDMRVEPATGTLHRPGHITEGSTAPGPKSLSWYSGFTPCTACLPEPERLDALLQSIDDRNLNRGAMIYRELDEISGELDTHVRDGNDLTGGNVDGERRPAGERVLVTLGDLALRYLTDTLILEDVRARLIANPAIPRNRHCQDRVSDITDRLRELLTTTADELHAAEYLSSYVSSQYGIEPDDTPTLVRLAGAEDFPEFGAPYGEDEDSALPLVLKVFFTEGGGFAESVCVMPLWAARALQLLRPQIVRSELFTGLGREVRETAMALWSPLRQELYNDLRQCVDAAISVTGSASQPATTA